jgi:hypothetical protein
VRLVAFDLDPAARPLQRSLAPMAALMRVRRAGFEFVCAFSKASTELRRA